MNIKKDKLQVPHAFTYMNQQFDYIEKRIIYNMLCRMNSGINVQPELFSKNITFTFNWKDLNTDFKGIVIACKRLMNRKMPIAFDIEKEIYREINPFEDCDIEKGVVKLKVTASAVPFFLEIGKGYSTLELKAALSLRSKYSQRFYELLTSRIRKEANGSLRRVNDWPFVSIEELKGLLGIDFNQLKGKNHFEDRVLKVAQAEIKANTDIDFEYVFDKDTKIGKLFTSVSFKIYPRQNGAEWEELRMEISDDVAQASHKDKFTHAIMLLSIKYSFTEPQKAIILNNQKAIDTLCRVHNEIDTGLRVIKKTPQDYMFSCLKEFLFS
jgi:plasmid replication initiation protein